MCRRLEIRVCFAIIWLLLAVFSAPAAAKTIYVDDDANGLNDGTSWQNAYNYLQDALTDANSSAKPVEIRVAQGIYRPDQTSLEPNGTGNREATFQLINGVIIKGGYAGSGDPNPNFRDVDVYKTTLSGDLNNNDIEVVHPIDLLNDPRRAENSYCVFYHSEELNLDDTAILDGFTITGGNANGSWQFNHADGGGMCNYESRPIVTACTFLRNSARRYGGGMYSNYYSRPILTNCTFTGNSAGNGGGMCNFKSSTTLTDCTFIANLATGSDSRGGGMYNIEHSSPTLTNCTIAYNNAQNGLAIACNSNWQMYPSSVKMVNCIIWNGPGWLSNIDRSKINITYSDVQGGWAGEGNINADPCFVEFGHWEDPCNTPYNPRDDIWINGDYHLKSQAGRWDVNEGRWTKDDITSPCIDAGDPASPIGLEPFPNGGIINMGAYGGTEEASKSYFGEPICETIVAGDTNGDCIVDFKDFAIMASHWLEEH